MLYWLVDHALLLYVLLGLFALGFLLVYRNHRDRRSLMAVFASVGLALLLWLLTLLIVTDRQQIERSLHAMTEAVLQKKPEELKKHLAADFTFRGLDRDKTAKTAVGVVDKYKIHGIRLTQIRFEELSHSEGKAKVFFSAIVDSGQFDYAAPTQCEAGFVLQNGTWLMRTIEVFGPVGRTPLSIPLQF